MVYLNRVLFDIEPKRQLPRLLRKVVSGECNVNRLHPVYIQLYYVIVTTQFLG